MQVNKTIKKTKKVYDTPERRRPLLRETYVCVYIYIYTHTHMSLAAGVVSVLGCRRPFSFSWLSYLLARVSFCVFYSCSWFAVCYSTFKAKKTKNKDLYAYIHRLYTIRTCATLYIPTYKYIYIYIYTHTYIHIL